jgi:hypothetical protein
MIRQDRELLAELARLNSDAAPLALRVIDGSITATEQHEFADRLVRLGQWFHQRAAGSFVIEGDISSR